jgi:cytosine deaminase
LRTFESEDSGLVRQFRIGTVIVGESVNFQGGIDWLRGIGVRVVDLQSQECTALLRDYISRHADIWFEDIGDAPHGTPPNGEPTP